LELGQPALDQREKRERLAEPRDAAKARKLGSRSAKSRLVAGRHLDFARIGPHGNRPLRRPVDQQSVPEGHPSQTQLYRLLRRAIPVL
jgi:hypothetical protein